MLRVDLEKTKQYYSSLKQDDLCDCNYCKNYCQQVKTEFPEIASYLASLGIDIEKPFETMPLEPDEMGYIEYISAEYIVYGEPDGFVKTVIDSVTVDVTDTHPSTQINEAHFVIEIYPVRLKWII